MKRTNNKANFNKGSVLAVALVAAGMGFAMPSQATDGDEVSVTVASVQHGFFFAAAQERTATTNPETSSATTESTHEAQGGAFSNEPKWQQRVLESS